MMILSINHDEFRGRCSVSDFDNIVVRQKKNYGLMTMLIH